MIITMKETRKGSEDGFAVKRYEAGKTYGIAHSLAVSFLKMDWAEVAV